MKKVTINENSYNKLINEITYGKVNDTNNASRNLFHDITMLFNKFKRGVEDVTYDYDGENPYLNDVLKYIGQIGDILDKKQMQRDNIDNELNKVDLGKFNDDPSVNDFDEHNERELIDLQRNYSKQQ